MYGQTIFDRRGRDVLTLAGFEDLLDAPGQAQVALGILLTLVTRAQKAIGGESLRGFLGILVVALHGRATKHQHFALLADAYLHIRIVLANPARLVTPGTTDMRITTVFRHAVDLLQVQSQAAIPVEQRLRHRRSTGQGKAYGIQTQAFEHLAPHQAPQQRYAQQAIQLARRHARDHPVMELAPDPRHTKKHRRPGTAQVFDKGFQTLGKKDALPGIDRRHLHKHAFRHMAQRQVGQQAILFTDIEQLDGTRGGKSKIAVIVHHPLGRTRGARGVDDGHQLLGRRTGTIGDRRAALQVAPQMIETSAGAQRQTDAAHSCGYAGRHGRPIVQLADKGQLGFGMLQHLTYRFGSQVRIKRHRDMPGHPDGQVSHNPVRAILGNDGNATERFELLLAQPGRSTARLFAHLCPGQGFQLATRQRLHHKAFIGMALFTLVEHIQR